MIGMDVRDGTRESEVVFASKGMMLVPMHREEDSVGPDRILEGSQNLNTRFGNFNNIAFLGSTVFVF